MRTCTCFWRLLAVIIVTTGWGFNLLAQPLDLGNGARFVIRRVNGVTLRMVFFDETRCEMRVLCNSGRESEKQLDVLGRQQKALAVCNGGYFDVGKRQPSGLEIACGVRCGTYVSGGENGGVFMVKAGRPALVWDAEFRDDPAISEMVQCNPWLVKDGNSWPPTPSGKTEPKNARTFILTDEAGHWGIGTAENAGLMELARILVTPGAVQEFPVRRALNLDGGPSSGLWFKTSDGRENLEKPGWIVRNAIAVIPKRP